MVRDPCRWIQMMKTLEGRWTRLDDCLLNHPEELTMRATSYFGGQFKMAAAMSVVFFFFSFLSGLGAATTYYHLLHHAHFDCNYGSAHVPLDWLFSTYAGSKAEV